MNGWPLIMAWISGLNLGVFICTLSLTNLGLAVATGIIAALDWEAIKS